VARGTLREGVVDDSSHVQADLTAYFVIVFANMSQERSKEYPITRDCFFFT